MSVNFQVDWLGINSTWQGISGQLVIALLSLGLIAKQRYDNKRDENVPDKEQVQTT